MAHKAIKRAIDRTNQENTASFASLHEKTSKINLSISDLHSDLKKLERMVMFDNDSSRSKSVDMEIKLAKIAQNLESKVSSCISENIAKIINTRFDAMEKKLSEKPTSRPSESSANKEWQGSICAMLDELKHMVLDMKQGFAALCMVIATQYRNEQIQKRQMAMVYNTQMLGFQQAEYSQLDTPTFPPQPQQQPTVSSPQAVVDARSKGLSPEELEKFYEPAEDENDSLRPFPNNKNPDTGEINGPRGPEPTRFGDWERKGRVSDF
ncbi:hypothetical protein GGI25_004032 [Coemansia spiralis]|uniref:Succinate dehydrogenase assembly factor 4, mitochondrial n=1 Tax=Coemansia spiralis TaxID=417178 RepID=A0A9W8KX07_9FUNG|nr:hypothetical protein GGI25_004032 [Coemansia spiralis]